MTSLFDKIFSVLVIILLSFFGFLIGAYIVPLYIDDGNSTNNFITNQTTVNTVDYAGEMTLDKAQSGIVTIYAKSEGQDDIESQGSGFMYTDEHIMTNDHVISGYSEFYVQYENGEWSDAELTGSDRDTDIGIIKPDYIPDDTPVLPMQMNTPSVGEAVVAIGSPSGLDNTVTMGVVSANKVSMGIETEFSIPDTIQTDAALNPGNSGGPLYSESSNSVIGVNRATVGENVGYAVSSRLAHSVGQSLIETGSKEHSYLGIETKELDYNKNISNNLDVDRGLIISDIEDEFLDSELNLLTLQDGYSTPDIIKSVDGVDIRTNEDLASYIAIYTEPSDEVELEIYRNGMIESKNVSVGNRMNIR